MSALAKLRESLRANHELPLSLGKVDLRTWELTVKDLEYLSNGGGTDKPPSEKVRAALLYFYQYPDLGNGHQARLVCFGCLEPVLPGGLRLIDDASRFSRLLEKLEAFVPAVRTYRRCYLALLYAYFAYDGEAADGFGGKNWHLLQSYLREHLNDIFVEGSVRQWAALLQANPELVGDDPGARFGQELLAGRSERFEQVRHELGIGGASWFVRKVVLAQVGIATRADDVGFRTYLPQLLELLEQHPAQLAEGLAAVLRRYHAMPAREMHAELRNFTVLHWKNPWFQANDGHWSRVEPVVRTMVKHWVNLDLIRQFFSLLATGDSNDKRRLAFWEKYHEKIDDIYFALGDTARWHKGSDYQEIRRKMAERRLNLNNAGSPENNAFIMCIGNYVIVEFGKHGNACYIHKRSSLPFELKSNVNGDGTGLKHESRFIRLRHNDTNLQSWEEKFSETVSALLQGRTPPAAGVSIVKPITIRGFDERAQATIARSDVPQHPSAARLLRASFSMVVLQIFCTGKQLKIVDLREKGGCLWVQNVGVDQHAISQLEAWGFQYKAEKGWWLKD